MMLRKIVLGSLFWVLATGMSAPSALAIPILQLYIEGSTYNTATETWDIGTTGSIRIWTIGNVAGPGGAGAITDVKLAIAYSTAYNPAFFLTPSTTAGNAGFFDPSTPQAPAWLQTSTDGSVPKLYSGQNLPSHGGYGPGVAWQEFGLGNLSLIDSPMADFINDVPALDANPAANGQINVYELTVSNAPEAPLTLHFDLYNHVQAGKKGKAVFAPFSHDGGGTLLPASNPPSSVPEPASLLLLGTGLSLLALSFRKG